MQNRSDLNLARKWRSQNFENIIGQDLAIRILKNSLYLNSFFPVYLFSGQRGCGKTTTARVFACAINCQALPDFQKDAKSFIVPCLKCNSCVSMQKSSHPDFIEIDAASHTGVDNIRNIIDSSSFLPLMGRKKIYLIDEAHMLSKAAFNAFLKILEEPPASVLFILATTDVQKIIETVRSRSFQIFFTAINNDILLNHLEQICKAESINYEISGLQLIAKQSQGSARDALNLLEQIRFAYPVVDKNAVLNTLGFLDDDSIILLFEQLIYKKNLEQFLKLIESINFYKFSAEFIWNKLLELFSISIKIKFNVLKINENLLNSIVNQSNLESIIFALEEFCRNEITFFKSINKSLFIELLCLRIIKNSGQKNILEIKTVEPEVKHIQENQVDNSWSNFLSEIKNLNEPLLVSILSQAKFVKFDEQKNQVCISFLKQSIFFNDIITDNMHLWLPCLKRVYNENITLITSFDGSEEINKNVPVKTNYEIKQKDNIDLSDNEKWKLTNELLKKFPGKITEIQKDFNE